MIKQDTPDTETETEDTAAVNTEALTTAANVAIAEANAACLIAEAATSKLREHAWTQHCAAVDAIVNDHVIAALERLPSDATPQQIRLAEYRAASMAKKEIAVRFETDRAEIGAEAVAATIDWHNKRAAAKEACAQVERPNNPWASMLIGSYAMMSVMKYMV